MLEMSAAMKYAPRYTIQDYRLWQGDWELWDGIAVAMTPSPFGKHQALLVSLASELRGALRVAGCGAIAIVELDWIISEHTVVRPDVIVVCGDAPEKHLERPPALIAEILSPSTRQNDLTYKRDLYASQGVGIYLIVDPEAKTIEQLSLTLAGTYESAHASSRLEVTICEDCAIGVDLKGLFSG
jgi:Uma2 family endonuclease